MAVNLLIDDFDTSTIGVNLLAFSARRAGPSRTWAVDRMPGRPEAVLLDTRPQYETRLLEFELLLRGTSLSNYLARLDELRARLKGGVSPASGTANEVEIETSDNASKVFRARYMSGLSEPVTTAVTSADRHQIVMLLLDPFLRDESVTTQTGITAATAIVLGTAPSWAVLRQHGDAAGVGDVTILYKNFTGGTVKTLRFVFSPTLGTGDWVDIDMDAGMGTVVDNLGANRIAERVSGSQFPWMLDPNDGNHWNAEYPTLETNDGTLDVTLTKRWEL